MSFLHRTLGDLATAVNSDGGWGYYADRTSHPEPTCLALLSLNTEPEKYKGLLSAGTDWLEKQVGEDGGVRHEQSRPFAQWPTAHTLLTLTQIAPSSGIIVKIVSNLLTTQGRVVDSDPEIADMMDIDLARIGWPWAVNNFSWVEPTAWAILALRVYASTTVSFKNPGNIASISGLEIVERSNARVREGNRLLLDRAFDTGGINYGNRTILGKMTDPIPTPTALMLLAMQGCEPHPRIEASKTYLYSQIEIDDTEHLAWASIALSCQMEDPQTAERVAAFRERLGRSVSSGKAFPNGSVTRMALTAIALADADRNPFLLLDSQRRLPEAGIGRMEETVEDTGPQPDPHRTLRERVRSKINRVLVQGMQAIRQFPTNSAVHIAEVHEYTDDLAGVLKKQYEHFRSTVPLAGKRVVLKPNLVEFHRDKVINTDPRFIAAVIELCQSEGASEVVVAEGPGHWRNTEFLVEQSGLGEVLRRYNVPFVDLNHDEPVKVLNLGKWTKLEYLWLTRTVTSADVFISLPKLKTHHWAGATLCLKNLFGTLPGICYGWPKNELHYRGIPESIIDIALTQTPHLGIVDGIVGMEGDGPLNGTARKVNALIMGADLVAVDATCCRLIGLSPHRVPTLVLGFQSRLGRIAEHEVVQLGEPIVRLAQNFELPPRVEKQLLPDSQPAEHLK